MSANSSILLTSLDFDALKANFIAFMRGSQSQFKDYDYTGPNLNVLTDELAYNTYLNSFYLNMIACEAFLDTAQKRDSVVSRAKELNYIPRSYRSSVATLSMAFSTSGLNGSLVIPEGTLFVGKNSNGSYDFLTDQTHTLLSGGTDYVISALNVYEGKLFTETFIVDNTLENQKFVFSNQKVDDTSVRVIVTENGGQRVTPHLKATNLFGLTSNSAVFFIQEDRDSVYEIYFGDGVFGRIPVDGAIIKATYRVTSGAKGNGVIRINLAEDLGPINGGIITSTSNVVSVSSDGADIEGMESVRFRAPKHYQVQDRAISSTDYKDMITRNFPEVEDVSVFGGEDISGSIQYGTVFVATTTFSGAPMSDSRKTDIVNFLADKKNFVKLSVLDPSYLYLVPSTTVYVNFANTSKTPADIVSEATQAIITFNENSLGKFNKKIMLSKFNRAIDDSDVSIEGSETDVVMYKNVLFSNGFPQTVTVDFGNPIIPGTIDSLSFLLSDGKLYRITDFNPINNTLVGSNRGDVVNKTNTVYFNQISTNNVQNYVNAGVVDYDKGKIYIQSINVFDFMNPAGIKIMATPATKEIQGVLQNIIEIDTTSIYVKPVEVNDNN
jgi:hypothetical protein